MRRRSSDTHHRTDEDTTAHAVDPARARFVQRFNHLRATVPGPDGKPYSYRDLAALLTEAGSPRTHSFVRDLLTGKAGPELRDLQAAAKVFGVLPEYFLKDDAYAADVDDQLADVRALAGIRTVAARGDLARLSPAALAYIRDVIATVIEQSKGPTGEGSDQRH